ncbi:hypothetical protein NKG94_01595 [Micromonospora sp. M12]
MIAMPQPRPSWFASAGRWAGEILGLSGRDGGRASASRSGAASPSARTTRTCPPPGWRPPSPPTTRRCSDPAT